MSTPAPINYTSSLAPLLLGIGGAKTVKTSNTGPLSDVYSKALSQSQLTPEQMSALIEASFRTGAAKVPELTHAYANAAGLRSTGNTGLQLALDNLNKELSENAAKTVLENNARNLQIAANAAGGISSGTMTQTQPNMLPALALLYGGGFLTNAFDKAGGFKGLFGSETPELTPEQIFSKNLEASDALQKGFGGNFVNPELTAIPQNYFGMDDPGFVPISDGWNGYMAPDVDAMWSAGDFGGFDWGFGGSGSGSGGFDPSFGDVWNFGDVGGFDWSPAPSFDAGSLWDFGDIGGFDWFFADGGKVKPFSSNRGMAESAVGNAAIPYRYINNPNFVDNMPRPLSPFLLDYLRVAPYLNMLPGQPGYMNKPTLTTLADGGPTVPRNINYMGTPAPKMGSGAINFTPEQILQQQLRQQQLLNMHREMSGQLPNAMPSSSGFGEGQTSTSGMTGMDGFSPGLGINSAAAGLAGNAVGVPGLGTVASIANAQTNTQAVNALTSALAGITAASMAANPIAGLLAAFAVSKSLEDPVDALNAQTALALSDALVQAEDPAAVEANNAAVAAAAEEAGITADNSPATMSVGEMAEAFGVADAVGPTDASDSAAGSTSGGSADGDASSADASGLGIGDPSAPGNSGYKSGGKVTGPGTSTSDSILVTSRDPGGRAIQYSDGEYVIPADIVRKLGTDVFDRLLQAFHTPVTR